LHDVGLAAWFGGTLANAVSLNAASAQADSDRDSGAVANTGWNRWTPVNAVAIGAHLIGSIGQIAGNRDRISNQQGVASMSVGKTALTAAALAATGYARVLGKKVNERTDVPVSGATSPGAATPADVAAAQQQLTIMQWVIPAITGALVAISSYAGEQQRPQAVAEGVAKRALS
jgi:hypothetical protein